MYEIYQELLDKNGLKSADVSRATGISNMTLSDWKKGKSKPKQDKLKLIADYFNVSVEYLMTGENNSPYSDDMAEMVSKIRNDVELSKALTKYFALSDDKKKHVVELMNLLSEVWDYEKCKRPIKIFIWE